MPNLSYSVDSTKGPILVAATITWGGAVVAGYDKRSNGKAGSTIIGSSVAVFIMLIFLFLLAEVNGKLAITFAWLIALGSLAVNGVPLLSTLTKLQSGTATYKPTAILPWKWPNFNPLSGWKWPNFNPLSSTIASSMIGGPASVPAPVDPNPKRYNPPGGKVPVVVK